MSDIQSITPGDPTGIRTVVSELLEDARQKNLSALAICYQRSDGSARTFWSGGDFICIGLLESAKNDILNGEPTATYEPLTIEEPEEQ